MKQEFVLILPDIRSCHNVGAMFRTADAFGVDKLYLCGYTATPPKPQIDKVSLGAETWIPWEHFDNAIDCISKLKQDGFSIVALEQADNSKSIEEESFKKPLALVVGNEVDGIDQDLLNMCDRIVHIAMYGKKKSLNVSVAVGAALFEIKRKLG